MLRVAFATADGTAVDEHFGRCERFDIYDLSAQDCKRVDVRVPAAAEGSTGPVDGRLDLLRDCAILHIASIGGAAAVRVVNARIHPVRVPIGTTIEDLVIRLQDVLSTNPSPWLRKILRQHDPGALPAWRPR